MKKLVFLTSLSLIVLACGSSKNKADEKFEVTLKFTTTSDYCNGARPNDRILSELKTPKSYSSKDIMLSTENKQNDSMITLSVDGEGIVNSLLTARTYYIFLPSKIYTTFTAGGNEEACKKWKNTPDGTFDIEKGMEDVEIRVHKTCSPCGAPRM